MSATNCPVFLVAEPQFPQRVTKKVMAAFAEFSAMKKRVLYTVFTVTAILVMPIAEAKQTITLPRIGVPETPGQQLQQAVNNPANADVRIHLASGSYILDPTGPNGGRLLLQPGMEIVGENEYVDCDGDSVWDPLVLCIDESLDPAQFTLDGSETLIDGSAIYSVLRGRGVVLAGRDNVISQVTIRAPRLGTVGSSLDINVADLSGNIRTIVRDSILEGGQRGIRCNNGSPQRDGISATATIERNIMRNNIPVPGGLFGFGIQIQNGISTDSEWKVTLRYNRITKGRFGLFVVANRAQGGLTVVHSSGNLIIDNEAGGLIMAAFAPFGGAPGDSSSDNAIRFDSKNDAFIDNVTPPENSEAFLDLGGGLMAFTAASDSPIAGIHANNELDLQLLHSRFEGNLGASGYPLHLTLAGFLASSLAGSSTATGNVLTLLMRDTATDREPGSFVVEDEIPATLEALNQFVIIGSDVALEHTNPGSDLESVGFFPSEE